jgi:hypothetical protein
VVIIVNIQKNNPITLKDSIGGSMEWKAHSSKEDGYTIESIFEEGGAKITFKPNGKVELFEIPLYGGEPRSYGEFDSIEDAQAVADKWT